MQTTYKFRCSEEELSEWRKCAKKSGQTLSAWVRLRCNAESGNRPPHLSVKFETGPVPTRAVPTRHHQNCNRGVCQGK